MYTFHAFDEAISICMLFSCNILVDADLADRCLREAERRRKETKREGSRVVGDIEIMLFTGVCSESKMSYAGAI